MKKIRTCPGILLTLGVVIFLVSTCSLPNESGDSDGTDKPVLLVIQEGIAIDEGSIFDCGSRERQTAEDISFSIANIGGAPLLLSAAPPVVITDDGHLWFTLNSPPVDTVEPGEDSQFSISFAPSGIGEKTAVVSIPSNDPLRTDFSFTIRGEGVAPLEQEIEIWRESTELFNGGLCYLDPPEVALGDELENLFTIKNTGSQELTLGTPLFWGGNATQFEISTSPDATVPAGGETTLGISFRPSSAGLKETTFAMSTNDSDENPFSFLLRGVGMAPFMHVASIGFPGGSINNGTGSAWIGKSLYGFVDVPAVRTFRISNTGTGALLLTSTPRVEISGPNASRFTVTVQPDSPVAAETGTTDFEISYQAVTASSVAATVSIDNNDPIRNPFTFEITGTGQYMGF